MQIWLEKSWPELANSMKEHAARGEAVVNVVKFTVPFEQGGMVTMDVPVLTSGYGNRLIQRLPDVTRMTTPITVSKADSKLEQKYLGALADGKLEIHILNFKEGLDTTHGMPIATAGYGTRVLTDLIKRLQSEQASQAPVGMTESDRKKILSIKRKGSWGTKECLEDAKFLVAKLGAPESISILSSGNADWYTTCTWFGHSVQHVFRGFSWGYGGEGPHGLQEFLRMCGIFTDMETISKIRDPISSDIKAALAAAEGESASMETKQTKAGFNLSQFIEKTAAEVAGDTHIEQKLRDAKPPLSEPEVITEKQLDDNENHEDGEGFQIETRLEKVRTGAATVLVEKLMDDSKSKIVQHRNSEAFEGDINKLEEQRIAKKKTAESEKPELASEIDKPRRFYEAGPDDFELRLAKMERVASGQGNPDFLHFVVNDIFTCHDQGLLERKGLDVVVLMSAACNEFLTGKEVYDDAFWDKIKRMAEGDENVTASAVGTKKTAGDDSWPVTEVDPMVAEDERLRQRYEDFELMQRGEPTSGFSPGGSGRSVKDELSPEVRKELHNYKAPEDEGIEFEDAELARSDVEKSLSVKKERLIDIGGTLMQGYKVKFDILPRYREGAKWVNEDELKGLIAAHVSGELGVEITTDYFGPLVKKADGGEVEFMMPAETPPL